jgi:hypothetical protein
MSDTHTLAHTIFDLLLPKCASASSIFRRICTVWPFASRFVSSATVPAT